MQCHSNQNQKEKGLALESNHKNGLPQWLFLCGLAAFGILIAVTVFKISLPNVLFYGIFLLCPLMHIFMMKDHGGHDHEDNQEEKK